MLEGLERSRRLHVGDCEYVRLVGHEIIEYIRHGSDFERETAIYTANQVSEVMYSPSTQTDLPRSVDVIEQIIAVHWAKLEFHFRVTGDTTYD